MITYEYPLNERIRTLLRLEDLFERSRHFIARTDPLDHHVALLTLFEILEVASRADLKSDLLQELERQKQVLLSFRNNPEISEEALSGVLRDIEQDVRDRDVLIIDDILESGRTLAFAKDLLTARGARQVHTAILLEKPGHLAADIKADFCGFICPDKFVVGYGMDMAHQFRELPFVGYVKTAS